MRNEFNDILDVEYFTSSLNWNPLLVPGLWYGKEMCYVLYCRSVEFYALGYTVHFKYSLDSHVLSISIDDDINSGMRYNVSTLRELEHYTSYDFIRRLFSKD